MPRTKGETKSSGEPNPGGKRSQQHQQEHEKPTDQAWRLGIVVLIRFAVRSSTRRSTIYRYRSFDAHAEASGGILPTDIDRIVGLDEIRMNLILES